MVPAYPTINQCLDFIDRYQMLDNIIAHSFKVARVAELIIDTLFLAGRANGPLLAREFVIAGALMHDIAKTACLNDKCRHDIIGQEICQSLGYPELGEIVLEHVILKKFNSELYKKGIFQAKEIVYYADKRVRHDEIVSLESRLLYIIERYGNGDSQREQYIRQNFRQCQDFELFLFTFLDFSPDQVDGLIANTPFARDD